MKKFVDKFKDYWLIIFAISIAIGLFWDVFVMVSDNSKGVKSINNNITEIKASLTRVGDNQSTIKESLKNLSGKTIRVDESVTSIVHRVDADKRNNLTIRDENNNAHWKALLEVANEKCTK